MKVNEPLGNASYAPVFIRFSLGIYFVLAGLVKLKDMSGFIAEVQSFGALPEHLAALFAILLPYLEVAAGALLVLGLWTTAAALITSVLMGAFVYAFGLFPSRPDLINKDLILLGASLSVLYSGAGAFSIDSFRKSGVKKAPAKG
jgi:uncharacterized membrane protein YphA (DoxX/SURF4 family)